MNPLNELQLLLTRRHFFGRAATGIGTAALASLLNPQLFAGTPAARRQRAQPAGTHGVLSALHFAPQGQAGHLPVHVRRAVAHRPVRLQAEAAASYHGTGAARLGPHGPAAHRHDLRARSRFPCVAPMFKFAQHGKCGHVGQRAAAAHRRRSPTTSPSSSRCNTEAINHDPAITFIQTGRQQPGRPSLGAWLSYGLGSANENLPAFVVMISQGSGNKTDQPLFSRLWGSGFLPSAAPGRAVPHAATIRCCTCPTRRASTPPRAAGMLDGVGELNQLAAAVVRRSGDQHPHRPVRDGLPHADLACRS